MALGFVGSTWIRVGQLPGQKISSVPVRVGTIPSVIGGRVNLPARDNVRMMASKDSGNSRFVVGLGLLAILLALATPALGPLLSSNSGMSSIEVDRRLNKVPLFSVTDETGKPFLSETNATRVGYFFFNPTDAENFLSKARDIDSAARVFPITLDEAYKFVKNEGGRSAGDSFKFVPKKAEIEAAKNLIGAEFMGSVPLFYVDGMSFESVGGDDRVIPLFFDKEDLEDTLSKLKQQNPSLADQLPETLSVIDLGSALDELRIGRNPALKNVAFYPSEAAVEYLRALKQGK